MVKETDKNIRVSWYLNTAFIDKTILSSESRTISNAMSRKKFLKYDFNAMEHAPKISTLWIFLIEKFSTVAFRPSVYFFKRLTKLVSTPILVHDFKMQLRL